MLVHLVVDSSVTSKRDILRLPVVAAMRAGNRKNTSDLIASKSNKPADITDTLTQMALAISTLMVDRGD